jgi:hypothetical protein
MDIYGQTDLICIIIGRETPRADYDILKVLVEDDDTNIDDLVKMFKDDGFVDIRYVERNIETDIDIQTGKITRFRVEKR